MATPDTRTAKDDPELNQADYRPTPYEDSSWEIVGDFVNSTDFEPLVFEVVGEDNLVSDPMFADFGGIPAHGEGLRTHTPTGEMYSPQKPRKRGVEEVEALEPGQIAIKKEDLERLQQEAFQKGKLEGIQETVHQADERLGKVEERFQAVLHDLSVQLGERILMLEAQAVQLSLDISEKLVGSAVEISPEYILGVVRDALRQAGGAQVKVVKVSPQDLEFLNLVNVEKHIKEFDGSWTFQADELIKAGCILMTSAGEVDFQLDKAWDRIRDQVIRVAS